MYSEKAFCSSTAKYLHGEISSVPGCLCAVGDSPATLRSFDSGSVKTSNLPSGVYRITVKGDDIYLNDARCVPINRRRVGSM